ncbi:hypothetical protein TWF481_002765 [Arthrobotrys musiformis]|uniref:Uncharacterized protein n=1 Tax=Arthrobotrys musiformis TaxID=47236 RepID=A0AAV9VS95_9PEZI
MCECRCAMDVLSQIAETLIKFGSPQDWNNAVSALYCTEHRPEIPANFIEGANPAIEEADDSSDLILGDAGDDLPRKFNDDEMDDWSGAVGLELLKFVGGDTLPRGDERVSKDQLVAASCPLRNSELSSEHKILGMSLDEVGFCQTPWDKICHDTLESFVLDTRPQIW